jgi:hypothetical protein
VDADAGLPWPGVASVCYGSTVWGAVDKLAITLYLYATDRGCHVWDAHNLQKLCIGCPVAQSIVEVIIYIQLFHCRFHCFEVERPHFEMFNFDYPSVTSFFCIIASDLFCPQNYNKIGFFIKFVGKT